MNSVSIYYKIIQWNLLTMATQGTGQYLNTLTSSTVVTNNQICSCQPNQYRILILFWQPNINYSPTIFGCNIPIDLSYLPVTFRTRRSLCATFLTGFTRRCGRRSRTTSGGCKRTTGAFVARSAVTSLRAMKIYYTRTELSQTSLRMTSARFSQTCPPLLRSRLSPSRV